MLLCNQSNLLELLNSLKLCSARTDDIETTCVSVCIDEVICEFNIIIIDKARWATLESKKDIILV